MSNLLSLQNKNQVGVGTNIINVNSDNLTIKENTQNYIVCNTNDNSLEIYKTIELEEETTLSTVKTHSISSAKLLYIGSNNEISSLALSSGYYLKVSNTGGLGLIDKTAPVLSNASSIGTTNDTTPDLTFSTTETGTLTTSMSEGFSSGSSVSITSTGSNTITFATLPSGTYPGYTITLTDSVGNVSNALTIPTFIIDTTAPVLSNASSIGTTTDTTPNLTFSTTETGTLTTSISEGFSSGASLSITSTGANTITFATLSNGTYSGKTITLTDTAGNASNALTIPTFIISTNPYTSPSIQYFMWQANQQTGSETRGDIGYVRIKSKLKDTNGTWVDSGTTAPTGNDILWHFHEWNNNISGYADASGPSNAGGNAYSNWSTYGVNHADNNAVPDEHIWRIVKNSNSNYPFYVINSQYSTSQYQVSLGVYDTNSTKFTSSTPHTTSNAPKFAIIPHSVIGGIQYYTITRSDGPTTPTGATNEDKLLYWWQSTASRSTTYNGYGYVNPITRSNHPSAHDTPTNDNKLFAFEFITGTITAPTSSCKDGINGWRIT